ncbi:hypothetical protein ABG067_004167 [Albugo candida]
MVRIPTKLQRLAVFSNMLLRVCFGHLRCLPGGTLSNSLDSAYTVTKRWATKKSRGSSKNGRDSESKRLGVKKFGGQAVIPGNIIIRQRGTKYHPARGVGIGKDHTIFAVREGYVRFWYNVPKKRQEVSVRNTPQRLVPSMQQQSELILYRKDAEIEGYHALTRNPYIQDIAIHDKYIAVTSPVELLILQIHFHDRQQPIQSVGDRISDHIKAQSGEENESQSLNQVPPDDIQCVKIRSAEDLRHLTKITVTSRARGRLDPITGLRKLKAGKRSPEEQNINHRADIADKKIQNVIVMESATEEASLLKGTIKPSDVRMNQTLSYYTTADDIATLLRRYFPLNHSVRKLQFLPETITYEGVIAVETQRYPRLLVTTMQHAFLYYFIRPRDENVRKEVSKKVLGKVEDNFTTSLPKHRPSRQVAFGQRVLRRKAKSKSITHLSHHVLVEYEFPLPVISIAANSSFLFVATSIGIQVWTIWNPCHYLAARHALAGWRETWLLQPSAPQLLCVQSIPFQSVKLVALDCHVVVVPANEAHACSSLQSESLEANFRLRENDFEVSKGQNNPFGRRITNWGISMKDTSRILILQQAPPSLLFSKLIQIFQASSDEETNSVQNQRLIDLMLSFFSLYRFRANVGLSVLKCFEAEINSKKAQRDKTFATDNLALEIETDIYDSLARKCAQVLANVFTKDPAARDIARAIPLFIASNVPPTEVLNRLECLETPDNSEQVSQAIKKYLKALAFPSQGKTLEENAHSRQSSKEVQDQGSDGIMQILLRYFGKYAPEQLARLVMDASLAWTCNDLELALEQLSIESKQTVTVQSAFLVLLLHGHKFGDRVDARRFPYLSKCSSYDTISNLVKAMLENSPQELSQLCVAHPELLIVAHDGNKTATSSFLSQAFLRLNPHIFVVTLGKTFFEMLMHMHKTVISAVFHCLSAIGPPALIYMDRMRSFYYEQSLTGYKDVSEEFKSSDCILVRFLWFLVQSFPSLDDKADQGELLEHDEDWKRTKLTLAMEYIYLVTRLSTTIRSKQSSQLYFELLPFFDDICPVQVIKHVEAKLAEWILKYLRTRCLEQEDVHDRPLLSLLYANVLSILTSGSSFVDYHSILECHGKARNALETLIALVSFPRKHRTSEGLDLLIRENACSAFLVPYAKNYCTHLEDWRYLISLLSVERISGEGDRQQLLQHILRDLANTLSPTELLDILPGDTDFLLYLPAITKCLQNSEKIPMNTREGRLC